MTTDESSRARALAAFQVLDIPPLPMFDQVVQVASLLCGTPIALISLVDKQRLFFLARAGLESREASSDRTMCNHSLLSPQELLEVHDARCDPRFADLPLVTGAPGVRFYAGAPLLTDAGEPIGTLCVIDRQPRTLTESQRVALESLAMITMHLMEGRRRELVLQQKLAECALVA